MIDMSARSPAAERDLNRPAAQQDRPVGHAHDVHPVVVAVARTAAAEEVLHLLDDDTADRLTGPRRDRTASAHALLRLLLAEVTGTPPQEHSLDRWCTTCGGPHGKPVLRHPHLHVGVASTPGTVVAAVTNAGALGIDVETVAATDFPGFADVALAPGELATTRPERARAWVRKEAALKATGHGLTVDPRRVDVRASLTAWPAAVRLADVAMGADLACAVGVVGHCRLEVTLVERTLRD